MCSIHIHLKKYETHTKILLYSKANAAVATGIVVMLLPIIRIHLFIVAEIGD